MSIEVHHEIQLLKYSHIQLPREMVTFALFICY